MLQSGQVKCWGANGTGELGNGTTTSKAAPSTITGDRQFTTVAASGATSCGLDGAGKAWCWGWHGWAYGGPNTIVTEPFALPGGLSFTQFVDFGLTKCGLQSSGQVWCWGGGWNGQRGDGTTSSSPGPTRVLISDPVTQISAKFGEHGCALSAASDLYCWGMNQYGQLGDGTLVNRSSPIKIASFKFSSVSAGNAHTCALATDGTAYCWGRNVNGQLGDGTTADKKVPTPVALGLKFTRISTGLNHTCAITAQPAGKMYCWGDGNSGKLGNGSAWGSASAPSSVNTTLTFTDIAIGWNTTCARTTGGLWYCWGRNFRPTIDPTITTSDQSIMSPVRLASDPGFTSLALGQEHACGVTAARVTYCWGMEHNGAITVPFTAPALVLGSIVFRPSR